jgi:DNA-binding NtrC family response regulator
MAETEHKKAAILIVDDEEDHAQVMCEALQRIGHRCEVTYNLAEASARFAKKKFDVVVTDLMMDGRRDGLEVLQLARQQMPAPPVILVTAHGAVKTYKEAMAFGAFDFIEKPLDLEDFRAQVNRAVDTAMLQRQNQVLQEQIDTQAGFEGIIGGSESMRKVIQTARQVAVSDIPVLVLGESGTGKELIARAIHNHSRRRKNRLVALNCAGLSENILEDELFGHVKGAFTGAATDREGRFEHADGGTLFMDEIGDMPSSMQAKLLRVLENGEVVRLGSNEPIQVDVRLISATNRKITEMVADRHFREDLYFRIKGVTIELPPLRERREDIPVLIHFFMNQAAERHHKTVDSMTPEARQVLLNFGWPGNVRQLKSTVENMVVLSQTGVLDVDTLPADIRPATPISSAGLNQVGGVKLEELEKEAIRNTLKMVHGNREQAAKILGIGERTLYRKIKDYGFGDVDDATEE